jgi:Outer membrane protein beta-barrel domain
MRRTSALVLALPLLAAPLPAQTRAAVGAFAGVNFAKFGGDDVGSVQTRTGIQVGAFAAIPLGRLLSVVPAVTYSQEGTDVNAGGGITGTFKLDYIEVPLLLKLGAPLQGSPTLRPYVVLGPAVGFEVGCKVAARSGSQSAEVNCDDATVGLQTKSVQAGLHFGAGLDISQFSIGLRYQLGLTSIDDSGANADVKNRVLAIVAGYGFRLGH